MKNTPLIRLSFVARKGDIKVFYSIDESLSIQFIQENLSDEHRSAYRQIVTNIHRSIREHLKIVELDQSPYMLIGAANADRFLKINSELTKFLPELESFGFGVEIKATPKALKITEGSC
jgi:hypothetical protein